VPGASNSNAVMALYSAIVVSSWSRWPVAELAIWSWF
jgi:hypothetical protein